MLFEEQISRKPDLYPWTKQFIEAIWKGFWTPEEFNFRSDYSQFKTDLSSEEREIVAWLQRVNLIAVTVINFAFQHVDSLNAAMLKGGKDI